MAFVDEIKLHLKAGRGGDGVVRWLHEKGKELGGPVGGNGSKGGDVYAVGVRDIGILSAYKNVKEFVAGRGGDGEGKVRQGAEGKDIEIKLPVGSRIRNLASGHIFELLEEGEKIKLLAGGRGGLGNEHYKSSTNIRPTEFTLGEEGDEADFEIELLMLVDVGLIGLPNAGKSTLLNTLTGARSKVGAYQFTTLEPSLGSFYGLIMADIPGLIEGAAEGKGLGHKFLRHIERTKSLFHLVSAEESDPVEAYQIVRKELGLYNKDLPAGEAGLLKKKELVLLTKVDMVSKEEQEKKLKMLKGAIPVSVLDDELIENLKKWITNLQ